jgi:hypothetical protein
VGPRTGLDGCRKSCSTGVQTPNCITEKSLGSLSTLTWPLIGAMVHRHKVVGGLSEKCILLNNEGSLVIPL